MTDATERTQQVENVPTCYRHADRETYIRCQRCDRHICPDCMRQASVGFHCPECVAEGSAGVRQPRTAYGAPVQTSSDLLTKLLIGVNVGVFLLIQLTGGLTSPLLARLAMIGRVEFIEGIGPASGVADGAVWRLLTSVFVHVDPLHLVFNMVALWVFGPILESLLGRVRYLVLFLLCGLAGSVAVYLLDSPYTFTIGASGAAFGLLGAALVISIQRGLDVRWLLGLLAVNVAFSFLGARISWQGHVGGLVAGLLLGTAIAYAPRERRSVATWAGFGLLLLGCVVAIGWRTVALRG